MTDQRYVDVWNKFTTLIPASARKDFLYYEASNDADSDTAAHVVQDESEGAESEQEGEFEEEETEEDEESEPEFQSQAVIEVQSQGNCEVESEVKNEDVQESEVESITEIKIDNSEVDLGDNIYTSNTAAIGYSTLSSWPGAFAKALTTKPYGVTGTIYAILCGGMPEVY